MTLLDAIVDDFEDYLSKNENYSKLPGFTQLTSIIPGRLYFGSTDLSTFKKYKNMQAKNIKNCHFFPLFNTEFVYVQYASDFGPYNLAVVYLFCALLLNELENNTQPIVHLAYPDEEDIVNSAFLMGCFGIIMLKLTPSQMLDKLNRNSVVEYKPYRDANCGECHYKLYLIDCLKAVFRANKLGILNFKTFDVNEYLHYDQVKNGDLNWIIPDKILAFCSPKDGRYLNSSCDHPPSHYFDYFKRHNVTTIVRLNRISYDKSDFVSAGFDHEDLYFEDGTWPTVVILTKFLEICDKSKGAIAVHCKAGLGRTGTLIGCYLMRRYRFSAREAIAWLRICRPGSVVGPQQFWLTEMQDSLWTGNKDPLKQLEFGSIEKRQSPRIKNRAETTAADSQQKSPKDSDNKKSDLRFAIPLKELSVKENTTDSKSTNKTVESTVEKETQGDRLNSLKHARDESIFEAINLMADRLSPLSIPRHSYNTRSSGKETIIPIQIEKDPVVLRKSARSSKGSLNHSWRVVPVREVKFVSPEVIKIKRTKKRNKVVHPLKSGRKLKN